MIESKECKILLQCTGDFLIRHQMQGPDMHTKTMTFVLSVAAKNSMSAEEDNDPKSTRIKSFGITQEENSFILQGSHEKFGSVKTMIDTYMSSRKPVRHNVILIKPIPRSSWELLISDVQLTDIELGKGSFGTVVKGTLLRKTEPPLEVAVKKMSSKMTENVFIETMQEARIMRMLDHCNVIKLHGVVIENQPIMLVIELMDGDSLNKMLRNKAVPSGYRTAIILAIIYGLTYVHEKGFIHRDIATRNVLISRDFKEVKIIDFGLSRSGLTYSITQPQKIPVKWLSPEVIHNGLFSNKSDVWALAVTIWEIYNDAAEPYPQKNNAEVKVILSNNATAASNMLTIDSCTSEEKPSNELCAIVSSMFSFEPENRPNMCDISTSFETTIMPVLNGSVFENCKYHQQRRPQFSSKMAVQGNSPVGQIPLNPIIAPGSTAGIAAINKKLKTATRKRKPKATPAAAGNSKGDAKQKTARRKNKK